MTKGSLTDSTLFRSEVACAPTVYSIDVSQASYNLVDFGADSQADDVTKAEDGVGGEEGAFSMCT